MSAPVGDLLGTECACARRGILHDAAAYPDPLRFAPERYADAKLNAERGTNEPPLAAFGFGRR